MAAAGGQGEGQTLAGFCRFKHNGISAAFPT